MEQEQQKTQKMNFSTYFTQKVAPAAEHIEKTRKKIINIAIKIFAVPVVLCVIFALLCLIAGGRDGKAQEALICALMLIVAPIFAVIVYMFSIKKIYNFYAKEILIPRLLGFWGQFRYYAPLNIFSAIYRAYKKKSGIKGFLSELRGPKDTNITINPITLARLFEFSTIEYDDKIVGKHGGVDIEMAEIDAYYNEKSGIDSETGKQRYSKKSSFKGIVFSAKLNKKFKGITVLSNSGINKRRVLHPRITPKEISQMNLTDVLTIGRQIADVVDAVNDYKKGVDKEEIAEKHAAGYSNEIEFQKENIEHSKNSEHNGNKEHLHLEDVHLEDPELMSKFKICSTDQIEVRYIFTTAFMERFMKMARCFNFKIKAMFIGNNMYIFIINRRKDWFEIPYFKSCQDAANYKEFLVDFSNLLSIVDDLKLNQNIGM